MSEISAMCKDSHCVTSNAKRICKNSKGNCMCECHMPKDWLTKEREISKLWFKNQKLLNTNYTKTNY